MSKSKKKKFATAPNFDLGAMYNDLYKVEVEEYYVEAYLRRAIDFGTFEPETKKALQEAAKTLADEIEGRCPVVIMPTARRAAAYAYGLDMPARLVAFFAATPGKTLSCTLLIDDFPEDWSLPDGLKALDRGDASAFLWAFLNDVINGDRDSDTRADLLGKIIFNRMALEGSFGNLKGYCNDIIKIGLSPLMAAIYCHKPNGGVAGASTLLVMPMNIEAQIKKLQEVAPPIHAQAVHA